MPPVLHTAGSRLESAQKAQIDHLGESRVHLVDQPGLVGAIGQEHSHQLGNLVAREHQPRVAATSVELGQALSEQRQHQAYRVGQRPARNEPRQARCAVGFVRVWAAFEEREALGFVQHQLEQQHGGLFPDARLQAQEALPQPLVVVAVKDALEEVHH